jgi:ribonuclease R
VAEFIGRQRGRQRTMVYRVHDEPNSDKLIRFQSFILRFGYYFKADKGKAVAKAMNRLMDKIRGKVEENAIATLAVRTMSKAFYTTDNIGHYGLAFPYYTHFTSPIRRYPDMMVHRLLAGYLAGAKSPDKRSIESLCESASEREEVASAAERSSIKYKMTEFMVDKVGMEFDGHISSLTEWGIYVELDDTQVEGMVALKDMNDDVYRFDEALYAVVGQSGRKFTLGDKVRIKVLRADLSKKQIDFELLYAIDLKSGRRTDMTRPKLIALDDRIYRKDPRDEKRSKRGRNGRR